MNSIGLNRPKNGFLVINKPPGPTSHDIIDELRKITGIRQIGHAGTLDPFASGLLLVGIGEATKLLRHYVGLDKKYEATLKLGATSDTYDRTGKISNNQFPISSKIPISKIQKVLTSFIGKQKQVPPMYSAKKIGGKKLYELARAGQNIKREANKIEIYDIQLKSHQFPNSPIPDTITINCHVSSGTYIRTLAHDIGQKLETGTYLEELKRTAIGEFKIEDAVSLDTLTQSNWQKHLLPLKTVLVSGTFDGLHAGHRNYFQQARQFGQRLICVVARDKIAAKIKGKPPHYSEKERIQFVKQCEAIDRVYLGIEGTDQQIYDFTASLRPDVIALGYDQTAYTANLQKEIKNRGLGTAVIRLEPFYPNKYKSSKLSVT